jgi:hypothetical protein
MVRADKQKDRQTDVLAEGQTHRQVEGWMVRRMDRRSGKWMEGQTTHEQTDVGRTNKQIYTQADRWKNKQMHRQTDGESNRLTKGRTDKQIDTQTE